MQKGLFTPDGFAIGLFCFGLVLFFLPLMRVAGAIALACAVAYWLVILIVRLAPKRG